MNSIFLKLGLLVLIYAFGISKTQAQTERCDSLIGEWLLTKVHYKFSKKPIEFPSEMQDFIAISRSGINYQVVAKPYDGSLVMTIAPTTDPAFLLRGFKIYNIEITSIQPNEITFNGVKEGRKCTATLTRKPS
jgi:hypothetical protein